MNYSLNNLRIGIVGLGYVGLPLAVEFGKKFDTIGFDVNENRVAELLSGTDSTLECLVEELSAAKKLTYSASLDDLKCCNVYIVTVPTPIDVDKRPDLTPLMKASENIGKVISEGDIVIYESTVYPGATEEECIPILERISGLTFNKDFFAGYSPERINPGDKERRVTTIKKVTSGSTPEIADFVDCIYSSIIVAGTHKAPSIKVAEAAKVIENVQRDVNIALINELYHIFNKMNINTKDVIDAAATKWNFMKLMPGLVGGHCISVDPYYLLHKSKSKGYVPDLIRKAREINDGMSSYVVTQFVESMIKSKINPVGLNVLLLGVTFKENCPDIRNTKVIDVYKEMQELGLNVDIYDPIANSDQVFDEYGVRIITELTKKYDVGFLAVAHDGIVEEVESKQVILNEGLIYNFKDIKF